MSKHIKIKLGNEVRVYKNFLTFCEKFKVTRTVNMSENNDEVTHITLTNESNPLEQIDIEFQPTKTVNINT